jgi:phage protein D
VGAAYRRREQKEESDLAFLQAACEEVGLALKVTDGQIAIFEEAREEQGESIGTIDLRGGHVLSWSFDDQDHDRYGSCRVRCMDPRTGKTIEGIYRDPNDDSGPTLEAVRFVATKAEAEEVAKGLLRRANVFASTGRLTVHGDPGLVAGVTFDLTNAYGFSGKFLVTKAEHRTQDGYTIGLDVRRCLEGY